MYLTLIVIPLIFIIGSTKKAAPAGGGHDDEPIVME
jgi:hypothetical protein